MRNENVFENQVLEYQVKEKKKIILQIGYLKLLYGIWVGTS